MHQFLLDYLHCIPSRSSMQTPALQSPEPQWGQEWCGVLPSTAEVTGIDDRCHQSEKENCLVVFLTRSIYYRCMKKYCIYWTIRRDFLLNLRFLHLRVILYTENKTQTYNSVMNIQRHCTLEFILQPQTCMHYIYTNRRAGPPCLCGCRMFTDIMGLAAPNYSSQLPIHRNHGADKYC